ncbi:hypothetical protein SAMN05444166_4129 [Singulisphaera sp. GP187]|uniref:hypothetical protein n=1 Tax=Singulisphaera sp. GP187 TaxID=1882752 RepID=UPI00092911AC|nr:hypothetical protein [Singulisphaera sp. GP187]SIO36597.1 hypothetical protein SAMN05444166_4129 [Singulisphaera sp. GP187]
MFKLSPRVWILNAAAVLSGQHGAVTQQAELAGCSRETVYEHSRKVEQRLKGEPTPEDVVELREENQRLRKRIAELKRETQGRILFDKAKQRQLTTAAFAMGVSLRQVEDLLGVLLAPEQVPDHSTLGRWVQDAARQAGQVLKALDPACATQIQTLAVDEIFFGGDRPWSGSSRRA